MKSGMIVTTEKIEAYRQDLQERERSRGTVEQYVRAVTHLAAYLGDRFLNPEALLEWKGDLLERRSIATVNAMIAAVNGFLAFCGYPELKLKIPLPLSWRPVTVHITELKQMCIKQLTVNLLSVTTMI